MGNRNYMYHGQSQHLGATMDAELVNWVHEKASEAGKTMREILTTILQTCKDEDWHFIAPDQPLIIKRPRHEA